jgi:hypothetical protein
MKVKGLIIIIILLLIVMGVAWVGIDLYEKKANQKTPVSSCDYGNSSRLYLHQTPNCPINFLCTQDKTPFSDECGCGCELKENLSESKTYCTPEQKSADVCFEIYQPVCGWFSKDIQCIKYPCADKYVNSCFACKDSKVEYWTAGECPS